MPLQRCVFACVRGACTCLCAGRCVRVRVRVVCVSVYELIYELMSLCAFCLENQTSIPPTGPNCAWTCSYWHHLSSRYCVRRNAPCNPSVFDFSPTTPLPSSALSPSPRCTLEPNFPASICDRRRSAPAHIATATRIHCLALCVAIGRGKGCMGECLQNDRFGGCSTGTPSTAAPRYAFLRICAGTQSVSTAPARTRIYIWTRTHLRRDPLRLSCAVTGI